MYRDDVRYLDYNKWAEVLGLAEEEADQSLSTSEAGSRGQTRLVSGVCALLGILAASRCQQVL